MEYRVLGRTGIRVSEIGMGLEHLLDKEQQVVTETIRAAVDGGVTYFDCHPGHDIQEDAIDYEGYAKLGVALQGIRDKLCLTYIALYSARSPADARPRFESYLSALKTDYTDVFIIQFCDKMSDYEAVTAKDGILEYAKQLKADGKARAIGISTHSAAVAHSAIDSGDFDMLMYPVNPAFDVLEGEERYEKEIIETLWDAAYDFKASGGSQPRRNVYVECERKDVGIAAMKPFAGGFIFGIEKDAGFTPVNLVSYALAQNGVSTVVPGCTCPGEINDILRYNTAPAELRDYSAAVAKSRWSVNGNCLYCNHCLPCSAGINIGQINRLLDAHERGVDISQKYSELKVKASACIECGSCAERCPFCVNVIDRMKRADKVFVSAESF